MVDIISHIRNTILTEANALIHIAENLSPDIHSAIDLLHQSKGRVIITGIGKSAIIGTKITATLNSTGTVAAFMHAGDAVHGDLGMVMKDDVILCLSKSGETSEIKNIIPALKAKNVPILAMTSVKGSYLDRISDTTILLPMDAEADPNGLAPSTSSTAMSAMGDALAFVLQKLNNFTREDFALLHPSGLLGKELNMKIEDLDLSRQAPSVHLSADVRALIVSITSGMVGATVVLGEDQKIEGIVTDGDLRRMLARYSDTKGLAARDIMSKAPKTIQSSALLTKALHDMEQHEITQLIAVDHLDNYQGIVHLHDIIKEGIGKK